jgi:ATP-dependent DNA helicase RecG
LPEPKIESLDGGILVSLFKEIDSVETVKITEFNNRQNLAVEYVKEHGQITNAQLQELLNLSESTILRELEDLIKKGILIKRGEKKGSYYILNQHFKNT